MMADGSPDVTGKIRVVWQLTLTLYACLLVNLTFDHMVIRQAFYWPVWLMQTVPLLLVLPGLLQSESLQRRARSGTWLCFIILFHFLAAIDNAAATGKIAFYGGMATLVLALFITSLLFVRWQRMQTPA
jgi:uncharacterized membrane protein